MFKIIDMCVCKIKVRDFKFKVFVFQYYGECYLGYDGLMNYNKYGFRFYSDKEFIYCWVGVGVGGLNFVYKFKE